MSIVSQQEVRGFDVPVNDLVVVHCTKVVKTVNVNLVIWELLCDTICWNKLSRLQKQFVIYEWGKVLEFFVFLEFFFGKPKKVTSKWHFFSKRISHFFPRIFFLKLFRKSSLQTLYFVEKHAEKIKLWNLFFKDFYQFFNIWSKSFFSKNYSE